LRACGEAGAEREKKERHGEDERLEGRPGENRNVEMWVGRKIAQIKGG
jgi:hypothetical protein